METTTLNNKEVILHILESVCDPEIPVLTLADMGIIRDVQFHNDEVEVIITPTYSSCPAMDAISMDIKMKLLEQGYKKIKVSSVLSPAWTTDWMSQEGKQKLEKYGIAPPRSRQEELSGKKIKCPNCGSDNTTVLSHFASTACKALYQCSDCKEPFDYFKCH